MATAPAATHAPPSVSSLPWERLDELVERAPDVDALLFHRLELFAVRRLRRLGRDVPAELARREQAANANRVLASAVLRLIREACDDEIVVIKGPEAAAAYPAPGLRPFSDLDILIRDPSRTRRALLAAGFVEVGDPSIYENIHHLRPLQLPHLPLAVELHDRPKWPPRCRPPAAEELLEAAVPSRFAGMLRLPPALHAIVLAAHGWAHMPLWRVLDLVDVAAAAGRLDDPEPAAFARRWGMSGPWAATRAAAEWLLYREGPRPWQLRVWARHLERVSDRTVLESHLERWLSPFTSYRPLTALRALGPVAVAEFAPGRGETWRDKLRRTAAAARHAKASHALHASTLGPAAQVRNRR